VLLYILKADKGVFERRELSAFFNLKAMFYEQELTDKERKLIIPSVAAFQKGERSEG